MDEDPAQVAVAERLQSLAEAMERWRPKSRGFLSGLLGSKPQPPPRGLYVHGKVGRGKTMLMDLFFESVAVQAKRRMHFHEFMAETHDRIGAARKAVDGDPIPHVASEIAAGAGLLCFDELHVTDIADAMILGRLFKALLEAQVVVVATS
ncbi:MAG TPA: cell division protein ZapE, partial [Hyphomicrobiaceae bacterium]|nr:cell division protein ZapE [Hyphomicrobiaceae bacterium]